jgi:hypothetical protein
MTCSYVLEFYVLLYLDGLEGISINKGILIYRMSTKMA